MLPTLLLLTATIGITWQDYDGFDNSYAFESAQHIVLKFQLSDMQFKAYSQGLKEEYDACKGYENLAESYLAMAQTARNTSSNLFLAGDSIGADRYLYSAAQFLQSAQIHICTRTTMQQLLKNKLR